jgi:hypothetical protein
MASQRRARRAAFDQPPQPRLEPQRQPQRGAAAAGGRNRSCFPARQRGFRFEAGAGRTQLSDRSSVARRHQRAAFVDGKNFMLLADRVVAPGADRRPPCSPKKQWAQSSSSSDAVRVAQARIGARSCGKPK